MQDFSFFSAPGTPAWEARACWAEQLCARDGVDPALVLSQQFLLTPSGTAAPASMLGVPMGVWILYHGANLPVATAPMGAQTQAGRVAVLGIAVDRDGHVITQERLEWLAQTHPVPLDLLDYLNDSAGRYAIIGMSGALQRVYLDSIGSLGAVYDPAAARVGSTLNLVLTRAPELNTDYPLMDEAMSGHSRLAFGHTPDTNVKRLIPNHFLDLKLLIPVRHWPGKDTLDEPDQADEPEVLRQIVLRLEAVIAALAHHAPGRVHLPLSGGLDSRLLLACSKPVLEHMDLFTHAENSISRKDLRIARHLAKGMGKPIRQIDPLRNDDYKITDPEHLADLAHAHRIISGLDDAPQTVRHEVLLAHEPGGIFLRGNGSDFLKAVLWRRGSAEYTEGRDHSIGTGIRMMMLGDKSTTTMPEIRAMYEEWYGSLPGSAQRRAYDLMLAEQFLSHGFGNLLYGFTNNFYICPFNDRRMLGAAASLPPDKRQQLHYNLAISNWRVPELRKVHYTKTSVSEHVHSLRESGAEVLSLS